MATIKLGESDYPKLLARIFDPPQIMHYKGKLVRELNLLKQPTLAIVGARHSTKYGESVAFDLAMELSRCGLIIVSGLAEGIDSAAHRGALEGTGKTIGVLGCGIDVVYPSCNKKLYQEVAEEGSLVSEYEGLTEPASWNFPARNRIISGLSRGVIVVEGLRKSGALITADFALEQGREVFAVPGSVRSILSRAPHELIKSGACMVEDAFDVLEEFGITSKDPSKKEREAKTKNTIEELGPDERRVLRAVGYEPLQIDEIIRASHLQTAKVNSILVMLELKKLVVRDEGRNYSRIK